MELFFPSHIPTFSSCLQLNLCLASPCNLEVSLRVLRWAQKTEWNLLNAADIRSGGDAPAGSTAGCQLMGLDVWVRLQDCPDFDNAWGQSERPCVQETSGVCHCRMALVLRGAQVWGTIVGSNVCRKTPLIYDPTFHYHGSQILNLSLFTLKKVFEH